MEAKFVTTKFSYILFYKKNPENDTDHSYKNMNNLEESLEVNPNEEDENIPPTQEDEANRSKRKKQPSKKAMENEEQEKIRAQGKKARSPESLKELLINSKQDPLVESPIDVPKTDIISTDMKNNEKNDDEKFCLCNKAYDTASGPQNAGQICFFTPCPQKCVF